MIRSKILRPGFQHFLPQRWVWPLPPANQTPGSPQCNHHPSITAQKRHSEIFMWYGWFSDHNCFHFLCIRHGLPVHRVKKDVRLVLIMQYCANVLGRFKDQDRFEKIADHLNSFKDCSKRVGLFSVGQMATVSI